MWTLTFRLVSIVSSIQRRKAQVWILLAASPCSLPLFYFKFLLFLFFLMFLGNRYSIDCMVWGMQCRTDFRTRARKHNELHFNHLTKPSRIKGNTSESLSCSLIIIFKGDCGSSERFSCFPSARWAKVRITNDKGEKNLLSIQFLSLLCSFYHNISDIAGLMKVMRPGDSFKSMGPFPTLNKKG